MSQALKSHWRTALFCVLLSAFVLVIAVCSSLFAQHPPTDLESLQGEWQITKLEGHGNTLLPNVLKGFKFVVNGNRLTYTLVMNNRTVSVEFSFAVDETSTPKSIDAKLLSGVFKHKVCPGIYDLRGDVLKVCLPEPPANKRPDRFHAPDGSGNLLLTLQRAPITAD